MDTLQVSRHFTVNVLLNSVGVDLDNENDSFLYDGKGVRISGIVTSHARLYDGHTLMGSGVTWAVSESSGVTLMNDGAATENTYPEGVYPTAAWIAPDGTVTVNGMTANTGLIRVRATYGGAYYYHDLTLKRINNGDKYDLLITPSSIPLDPNVTYATQTLTISATRLNVSGQTYDVTLNSDGIYLAAYYQPDAESSPAWYQSSGSFSVTEAIAKNNHNIRFELRKVKSGQTYDKDTPSTYTVEDYETIPIAKDGKNGENSVRLGIDNEHEDFLYDGTTRVAPSSGAVVNARLFNGATQQTTGIEWKINDTNDEGNWHTSVNTNATASITVTDGTCVMTVTQLIASSARIRVRAKYKDKYYYAEFTANKTNQDKYDIVLTPNSIAFNAATYETQRITVGATGIGIGGTKLSPTISTTANQGNLRVFWATVSINGSGDTVIGTMNRLTTNLYKDVAKAECEANVGIYFELRWYFSASTADSGAASTYRVCDYETVEIAKVTNGAKGDDGADGLYYVEEYARGSSRTYYAPAYIDSTPGTSPIDGTPGWVSSAPSPTTTYPYIWKRVALYDPNTSQYDSWSYICETGSDGRSVRGHTGRLYYYAGEYDDEKDYYMEETQSPYVSVTSGNSVTFWMLDFGGVEPSSIPAHSQGAPGAGSTEWTQMSSEQQYYIAKAFFGDFAHFASAIISGDFLISQYGYIRGRDESRTPVNDGTQYIYLDPDDVDGTESYDDKPFVVSRYYQNPKEDFTTTAEELDHSISFNLEKGRYYTLQIDGCADGGNLVVEIYSGNTLVRRAFINTYTADDVFYPHYDLFKPSSNYTGCTFMVRKQSSSVGTAQIKNVMLQKAQFVPNVILNMLTGKIDANDIVARGELHADGFYYTSVLGNSNNDVINVGEESIVMLGTVAVGTKVVLPSPSSCKGRKIEVFSIVQNGSSWYVSWTGADESGSSDDYFVTMPITTTSTPNEPREWVHAGYSIGASTYVMFYSDGSKWWILKHEAVVMESGYAKVVNKLYYE